MKRLVLLAVLTMFSTSFLTACNTMAGAGKDVEKAVRANRISLNESRLFLRFYESGLEGYTYLEEP